MIFRSFNFFEAYNSVQEQVLYVLISMSLIFPGTCVMSEPIIPMILDSKVLEVNLRVLWEVARVDKRINPDNLRFSLYRTIFHWLFAGQAPKGADHRQKYLGISSIKLFYCCRSALPACVVAKIRDRFPDPDGLYAGFKQSKKKKN